MTDPTKPPRTPRDTERPLDPQAPRDQPPLHVDVDPEGSTPDEIIDRESEASFPASDPPSFTPLHIGEPDVEPEPQHPSAP